MWWAWLFACAPSAADLAWVRGGTLVVRADGTSDGSPLAVRDWRPGEWVDGQAAPVVADCVPLFTVPLDPVVARAVAAGGDAPEVALAFSPDGRWLAIGSATGAVHLVDGWTGEERARTQLAEAAVRQVVWSADGRWLWVGEQSPDAHVRRLAVDGLREVGRFRAADALGGGVWPSWDDPWGIYSLPAITGLVADGDGVIAVAARGWSEEGRRRNAAMVWRLDASAQVAAAAFAQPVDAVLPAVAWDAERLAVAVRRSADGPPQSAASQSTALVLDRRTLAPRGQVVLPAWSTAFPQVFVGEAIAIDPRGLWLGTADGRVVFADPDTGAVRAVATLGVPVDAAGAPLAAPVGWLAPWGDALAVVTTRAFVPLGSERPEARPVSLHPAENSVWALDPATLAARWQWQGPHQLQGLAVRGGALAVGAGAREGDRRRDLFGTVVFDAARGPDDRVAATCGAAAPVFFRFAFAADGRIAAAEVPFRTEDGVAGAYRVRVWR